MGREPSGPWPRVILHADMDAFYAAVEQLDQPELRGKPVLVGSPSSRGVVSTASYEARPYGVGSAMPMVQARRLCPQAVIVPPRFSRYQEVSRCIMEVFGRFSPTVEPLSLDEAFLDLSGTERLFGPPAKTAAALKAAVREATCGLTVSVGLSCTKFVAKVASDHDKPDGLVVVPPDQVLAFLHGLPIKRLWGVGPKAEARLTDLGLQTIGDVANASPSYLQERLGALGQHISQLARAEDPRAVVPPRQAKSIGCERTLDQDIVGIAHIKPHLLKSADDVARRLRGHGVRAGGVRLKLKTAKFKLLTRQSPLTPPVDSADRLYEAACELLETLAPEEPMRLVGLAAFALSAPHDPVQGDLFASPALEAERRQRRLDQTLDDVRRRFGARSVRRASDDDA